MLLGQGTTTTWGGEDGHEEQEEGRRTLSLGWQGAVPFSESLICSLEQVTEGRYELRTAVTVEQAEEPGEEEVEVNRKGYHIQCCGCT